MAETEDTPEVTVSFLENDPPPLVARGLALLLIAIFVAAAVLASVIQVPETVKAGFVLVPLRGADPVRAARAGRVLSAHSTESARVAKGSLLFVLQSPGAADRAAELQTAEAREASVRQGLANAQRKYESETLAAEEETRRLRERLAFLDRMLLLKKEQLSLTAEQAARAEKLHAEGLASLDEQSDAQIRNSQTAMEMEQLKTDRRETLSAIEKQRHTDESRRSAFREEERTLLEQAGEARIKIEALRADAPGGAAGELAVTAPCDGTVLKLLVNSAGAFVQEGDTMAEVACTGERLQAELTVPQGGLSRIRPGQPVKLLYEAFPYQRFGIKNGIIRWASPAGAPAKTTAVTPDAEEPAPGFRAFAELVEEKVRVDGEDRAFLPGMKGDALVVVGRRSVISYAFDPLRQLRESLR